ncbi:uncharacterized protein FOMMEDRAFT_138179 [Fomitiporia mediterranea MF3/22]|uniref:uncharacterized protein n=1 Tax=Fomitiporia mediterranea (strain MF3/22) TaxID=694068 RepID=UPI0004409130|nr:uncharacterized protein FOMMEDRAFT_138179 [Fomitiporia mediterranea MF3/22]EJD08241.1 hypothetical protein FOMMEDRAFT_138179 [Fomitiporia mediterranea MF3/22]
MPKSGRAMHSEQSDIWAFGMTIYELLTRKRPYYHLVCDPQVITSIICGELPRRPNHHRAGGESMAICGVYVRRVG